MIYFKKKCHLEHDTWTLKKKGIKLKNEILERPKLEEIF
jgi:hypothetical protein